MFDTHIGLCTSHGVVTPGPRHSRFTLSRRKIVLSPGSLNSTFETISFTRLDPNLIIRFKTKMHVVSNEFLILNSRLNIQSYSRTRTSGETSSSRRRPPFLLHFLLLVLLSNAAGRSTNQSKISSSSYMYVLLNQQNLVFFFVVGNLCEGSRFCGVIILLKETSQQSEIFFDHDYRGFLIHHPCTYFNIFIYNPAAAADTPSRTTQYIYTYNINVCCVCVCIPAHSISNRQTRDFSTTICLSIYIYPHSPHRRFTHTQKNLQERNPTQWETVSNRSIKQRVLETSLSVVVRM